MTAGTILDIRNVSKSFGGLLANDDISLAVPQGEILGLIGPNGAGKSTLFNMIAGAYPVSTGQIWLDGEDITALPGTVRCALGVARTFQVPKSFDTMTVLENVMVGSFIRTAAATAARRHAMETLEFVGIAGRAHAPAVDLTPPEKRRLEMARALATKPKLLLLDEVMTGLTPSEAKAGVELVRAVREQGVTIIMVEHVMEIVMPLVDRAVVLHLGQVLAEGKPADVVCDQNVIKAYLGDRHRAA
jgi:branched-chain amino acid transport system ATP-binding protein